MNLALKPLLAVPAVPRQVRYPLPDQLRGFAIVLMVLFHGWYDLSIFDMVAMDFDHLFWRSFRAIIVGLFCLMAGASLYWTHHKGIRWRLLGRRQFQLILAAGSLTVFSLLAYPSAWIYFGILHFFVIALVVSLPLVRFPRTATLAGLILVVAERLGAPFTDPWLSIALQQHIGLPKSTIDRMYLLPWLGVVWMGIGLGAHPIMRAAWQPRALRPLTWMGQHPLMLYLVHQPILFSLAWLVYW
ncbi:MAG: heparan-alpha-glucosaminide N-acetyltransferase, partial [Natronospirillum sp.]